MQVGRACVAIIMSVCPTVTFLYIHCVRQRCRTFSPAAVAYFCHSRSSLLLRKSRGKNPTASFLTEAQKVQIWCMRTCDAHRHVAVCWKRFKIRARLLWNSNTKSSGLLNRIIADKLEWP